MLACRFMATKEYKYPLQVRITEELHERFSAMAGHRGQSLTSAATIAVLAEVERFESSQKRPKREKSTRGR